MSTCSTCSISYSLLKKNKIPGKYCNEENDIQNCIIFNLIFITRPTSLVASEKEPSYIVMLDNFN